MNWAVVERLIDVVLLAFVVAFARARGRISPEDPICRDSALCLGQLLRRFLTGLPR